VVWDIVQLAPGGNVPPPAEVLPPPAALPAVMSFAFARVEVFGCVAGCAAGALAAGAGAGARTTGGLTTTGGGGM